MSQSDIYDLLKTKRLSGDHRYFTALEIMKSLNAKGISINSTSVNANIVKLRTFGYLDMRVDVRKRGRITFPFAVYRLKIEYLT